MKTLLEFASPKRMIIDNHAEGYPNSICASEENFIIQKKNDENTDHDEQLLTAELQTSEKRIKNCVVCFDEEANTALVSCGHVFGANCVGRLDKKICPICRQTFTATVKPIY